MSAPDPVELIAQRREIQGLRRELGNLNASAYRIARALEIMALRTEADRFASLASDADHRVREDAKKEGERLVGILRALRNAIG